MGDDEPLIPPESVCRHCKRKIYFHWTIANQWVHGYGGTYCLDDRGYTNSSLHAAQPVLHDEEVPVL